MAESLMTNSDPSFVAVTTPAAGYAVGEVIQLPDGRAGALRGLTARTVGQQAAFSVQGKVTLTKGASLVVLKGAPIYWDRSAGSATPLQAAAGGDFYAGVATDDVAAATLTVTVDLNVQPVYLIDLLRDPVDSVAVGDAVLKMEGGLAKFSILATSEAEKIDALSVASVPVVSGSAIPFIVEGQMRVFDIGSDNTVDMNVGLANATHATSADTIAESVFLHLDETLDINAESDDGTTEVAATDTTVDCVESTYFDFALDCRDLTDIQIYINGVNVLPASVFALGDATGPIKLAVHVEKTTGTAVGELRVSKLALRATDLAS